MSVEIFQIICRLCGEESSELIRLHVRKSRPRSLKVSIKKYIGIKVTPGDGLPDQICGPCIAKLDETTDFIEKCLKIQNNFQIISDAHAAQSEGGGEVTIKAEPFEDQSLLVGNLVTSILDERPETFNNADLNAGPSYDPQTEEETKSEPCTENATEFVDMSYVEEDELRDCTETRKRKVRQCRKKSEVDPLISSLKETPNLHKQDTKLMVRSAPPKSGIRRKAGLYHCIQCSKSYTLRDSLKSHIKRVHKSCMEKCPKCPKVLRSKYLWKTHIHIHSDEKPFRCDQCDKSYSSNLMLRIHKDTHTPIEQRYKFDCDVCGKKFASKGAIKTHMKQHTGLTPFICDQCGKSYQTKSNLQIHYRVHTGEKPYECGVCGKRYTHAKTFQIHQRTHSGARPYVCQHCAKSFYSTAVLKRHLLIHTGSRPYPCIYCGKSFRDRWKRKVHERIHTGERPYQCTLCASAFYESGNLQKHCRNVHNRDYRNPSLLLTGEGQEHNQEQEQGGDLYKQEGFSGLTTDEGINHLGLEEEEEEDEDEEDESQSNPLLGHTIFSNSMELLNATQLPG